MKGKIAINGVAIGFREVIEEKGRTKRKRERKNEGEKEEKKFLKPYYDGVLRGFRKKRKGEISL